jgi:hypothetical protein
MLARGLEFVGVPSGVSLVLVMTLSGVGFYLALRKLALEFVDLSERQELGILVGVIGSMLLLCQWRTPYDLMTAFLFTLAFYYIYTIEVWKYLLVFTLACINRETAFLLILISVVVWSGLLKYKPYRLELWNGWLVQIGIFVLTTLIIRIRFADYPGLPLWINPVENIQQMASHPYEFIFGVFFVSGMMAWMFRKPQPAFLKMSFIILTPALLIMWVVCGQWSEIRVWWEVMPVVILLMVL